MFGSRAFFKTLAAVWVCGAALAQAQNFPAKPIAVIVPFAAGGGVDSTARLIMPKLADQLKQAVVIDNVAGAAGTIGTLKAARAPKWPSGTSHR